MAAQGRNVDLRSQRHPLRFLLHPLAVLLPARARLLLVHARGHRQEGHQWTMHIVLDNYTQAELSKGVRDLRTVFESAEKDRKAPALSTSVPLQVDCQGSSGAHSTPQKCSAFSH